MPSEQILVVFVIPLAVTAIFIRKYTVRKLLALHRC
jgi:hypothetical protein